MTFVDSGLISIIGWAKVFMNLIQDRQTFGTQSDEQYFETYDMMPLSISKDQ